MHQTEQKRYSKINSTRTMRDLRRPHGDLLLYYDPSWIYAGSHQSGNTGCIPHGRDPR